MFSAHVLVGAHVLETHSFADPETSKEIIDKFFASNVSPNDSLQLAMAQFFNLVMCLKLSMHEESIKYFIVKLKESGYNLGNLDYYYSFENACRMGNFAFAKVMLADGINIFDFAEPYKIYKLKDELEELSQNAADHPGKQAQFIAIKKYIEDYFNKFKKDFLQKYKQVLQTIRTQLSSPEHASIFGIAVEGVPHKVPRYVADFLILIHEAEIVPENEFSFDKYIELHAKFDEHAQSKLLNSSCFSLRCGDGGVKLKLHQSMTETLLSENLAADSKKLPYAESKISDGYFGMRILANLMGTVT